MERAMQNGELSFSFISEQLQLLLESGSTRARQVRPLKAAQSLTAEDVLLLPPPAASAAMLSPPCPSPPLTGSITLPPPLFPPSFPCCCSCHMHSMCVSAALLTGWLWRRCSPSPWVELSTLGRQLLQRRVRSSIHRHPVSQWDKIQPRTPCTPPPTHPLTTASPTLPRFATPYALLKTLFLKGC